jgi:hypothetical protein
LGGLPVETAFDNIEYAKNPYYNTDVRGLVKLVYNFDFMPDAQGRK